MSESGMFDVRDLAGGGRREAGWECLRQFG